MRVAEIPRVTQSDRLHLDRLRDRLRKDLSAAMRGRTEAVVLDVPVHRNAGDLLILRGLIDSLDEMGIRVRLMQDWRLTSWRRLRRLPTGTAVLLNGGGNFGGLYPARDEYRAAVLRSVPAEQVVVLPQSVSLANGAQADAIRSLYGGHPEAVFMIRDRASAERLAAAAPSLAGSIRHTPDLGFGARLVPQSVPEAAIRIIKRGDKESVLDCLINVPFSEGVIASDWPSFDLDDTGFRALARFLRHRERIQRQLVRLSLPPRVMGAAQTALEREWEPKQQRLLRAHMAMCVAILQRALEQGRVIVTDRLHGHIGASLLGIPSVVLSSRDGKGHALIADWTGGHVDDFRRG